MLTYPRKGRQRGEFGSVQFSKRYVRALMENAGDVTVVISCDGLLDFVGGAVRRLFGYDPESVTGTDMLNYVHPDDRDGVQRCLARRLVRSGSHATTVCRLRHADGGWRHAEVTASSLVDDPDVQGVVVNVHDVTERIVAEQRLRASRALYHTLAESAPVGIFQTDPSGGVIFANRRFTVLTGLSQAAAMGDGWLAAVHPDDRGRVTAEWTRAMVERRPMLVDLRFLARVDEGGEAAAEASVLCQSTPMLDAAGNFQGCVGTITDMTEYVRTVEALMMAEARTNAIVDAAADAILTIDDQGILHSVNRAAEAMFGVPVGDLLWQPVARVMPSESTDWPAASIPGAPRETTGLRRDGTRFPIELSVNGIDVGGRRLFVAIVRDVTERKRIERELIEARDAAETADHAKSAFLAVMSHELRTPLNAVIGFAQVIEMRLLGGAEVDRYTDYASSIRQSGEHLLGIIEDILDITKIESGDLDLADGPVDVADLVGQSLNLVAMQAGKRGVALSVDLPADLPALRGDELRLRQILVNLLSNGVKFSKTGGQVTVGAALASDGGLTLFVSDRGIGMAPEDVPKALTPFTQVDQSVARRYEGTGLGLPITKRLVEMHGGTLTIQSALGEGTAIFIALPPERVLDLGSLASV